ncbi:MAG: 2-oxoglutarate ferredoxin oxidoreductase subunit beta [Chloroflexi bacterium HGW-Chloroflexi-10]|nr:MAG: 2-oxoglutarate ferredoxin oxidoreductase subunit beta [Chloroflexi bacterium HGW-Chloroflexi-10]
MSIISEPKNATTNAVGLGRADYKGANSTLCQGCGHNSISSQIVAACFELNIIPENIVKFSGIGCSSKSPTYFLNRSFGFNGLHGRMPSLALGALFADTSLKGLGVSGDGDTASIGMGQFKHLARRNMHMVYIVENNGVYGLTKGQFSATAEDGLILKKQGTNQYLPVDICMEALVTNASFVARGFAGDPKQLKNLLKAAFSHDGLSVLDIISPCVTFHNKENSFHSYQWGKEHEVQLHDITFVPAREEITIEDFEPGSTKEVTMHDGSLVVLKKLDKDYDPTNRYEALRVLEESAKNNTMVTGLLYVDPEAKTLFDRYKMPSKALNRLTPEEIRPSEDSLKMINEMLFLM